MESPLSNADQAEVVSDFYGVYLLYNINPQYLGRTYIGYTRNPTRRIMQHNRGIWAGGANRTNNKGPWKMILIIHGFPNNIAALRFEWAWQHPDKSTRLQHIEHRKRIPRKEKELDLRLRIMCEMLRVGPWCRLPLTLQWLEKEFYRPFHIEKHPPSHMIIKQGPVKSKNARRKKNTHIANQAQLCSICYKIIDNDNSKLRCMSQSCGMIFHVNCLGNLFLNGGDYIPVSGKCPKCYIEMLWGDLIRKLNCGHGEVDISNDDSGDCESEDLSQRQELDFVSLTSSDEDL